MNLVLQRMFNDSHDGTHVPHAYTGDARRTKQGVRGQLSVAGRGEETYGRADGGVGDPRRTRSCSLPGTGCGVEGGRFRSRERTSYATRHLLPMSYQHGHRRVPSRETRSRERSRKVAKAQKRARKEFSDVFVNPNVRVAAVVDEAVLAHASGWYQATGSRERGRLCRVERGLIEES
jgi:hypothetical protein